MTDSKQPEAVVIDQAETVDPARIPEASSSADRQISTQRQAQVPASMAQTETMQLINAFTQLAMNPDIPVERMTAVMDMQERVLNRQAEMEFNAAMNKAQAAMGRISADARNPQTRSQYASYAQLDRALRPIYTANGFSLSFDTGDAPADVLMVQCYVSHSGGHSRTYKVPMPADGKGAKGGDVMTKTHATGSAMTYGMRYLLKLIFNVAIGADDDDDGNAATAKPTISNEQATILQAMLTDSGMDDATVTKWLMKLARAFGKTQYTEIGADMFERAKAILVDELDKRAKKGARQ